MTDPQGEARILPEPFDLEKAIEYAKHYGPRCRDCADENGVCPSNGLPCGEDKGIRHVVGAIHYGLTHGYIKARTPAIADGVGVDYDATAAFKALMNDLRGSDKRQLTDVQLEDEAKVLASLSRRPREDKRVTKEQAEFLIDVIESVSTPPQAAMDEG